MYFVGKATKENLALAFKYYWFLWFFYVGLFFPEMKIC